MSTPSPYPPQPRRTETLALVRDALAVALILVGVAATVGILFTIDTKAGLLAVSVLMVAAGILLAYRRPSR